MLCTVLMTFLSLLKEALQPNNESSIDVLPLLQTLAKDIHEVKTSLSDIKGEHLSKSNSQFQLI